MVLKKKISLCAAAFFVVVLFLGIFQVANAAGLVPQSCLGDAKACGLCSFLETFILASDAIMGLAGAFSVVMIVWGGIIMITAYGNEQRVAWGKNMIIAVIIGIFVVMLAWLLVNLIIGGLTEGGSPLVAQINGQSWNACPTITIK